MKVLITVPDLSLPGGVTNIYRSFDWNKGDGVTYFYVNKNDFSNRFLFVPKMIFNFLWNLRQFDLVQINPSLNARSVIRDGFLLVMAKSFNKQVLVFFHGWDDDFEAKVSSNAIFKKLFINVFNKADGFCLLGMVFNQKLLKIGISPKPVFYVPTVADDRYLETNFKKNKTDSKIVSLLFLARFDHNKGMDIALDAFDKLKALQNFYQFKLIMAGDGPLLKHYQRLTEINNISDVYFKGYVEGESKHKILLEADILFFPTFYGEGLPCVIMEAMLYGLPVVTRPVGAIPDWVGHNINGWLSDSLDPEIFAKGILELVQQPDLLKCISETNRLTAKKYFTPLKVKSQLQEIHRQFEKKNDNDPSLGIN